MNKKRIKTMIFNECDLLKSTLKNDDFVGFSLPVKMNNKDFIINKIKEIQSHCNDEFSIYKLKYLINSFKSWDYLINFKSRNKIKILCFDIVNLIEGVRSWKTFINF